MSWLYAVIYRSLLGAALAYYLNDIINRSFLMQLLFFVVLAIITVLIDCWPRGLFRPYAAKIQDGKLHLLGQQLVLTDIEYIHYEMASAYQHQLSIKVDGCLPLRLQVTEVDFLDSHRLLSFLRQHYPAVTVVDSLN